MEKNEVNEIGSSPEEADSNNQSHSEIPDVFMLKLTNNSQAERLRVKFGTNELSMSGDDDTGVVIDVHMVDEDRQRIECEFLGETVNACLQKLHTKVELYTTSDKCNMFKNADIGYMAVASDTCDDVPYALTSQVKELLGMGEVADQYDDEVWQEAIKLLSDDAEAVEIEYELLDANGQVIDAYRGLPSPSPQTDQEDSEDKQVLSSKLSEQSNQQ